MLAVLLLDRWVDFPFVPVINNARRWFRVGAGGYFVQLQPSEFFKLAYILSLCWYLRYRSNYRSIKALAGPFILTLVPIFFIRAEPDLGTALLLIPILLTMLFLAGAKVKHLVLIVLLSVLISPLMWHRLRPYQRTRISSVLLQSGWVRRQAEQKPALGRMLVGSAFNEKQWKNNWGYHLIRAKFSVASGRLTGYGYRNGPFIKYNFLPERHNDFIFAVMAHQWGFVGALGVLALYAVIIICGMEIMSYNTDPFGRLLAAGIVVMFAVEVLVNVSMTLGLMPITGLTLPLVSYGGSSLAVNMISIGLLNNIGRSRPFSVAERT
jgi:rod shape determining protein RodA